MLKILCLDNIWKPSKNVVEGIGEGLGMPPVIHCKAKIIGLDDFGCKVVTNLLEDYYQKNGKIADYEEVTSLDEISETEEFFTLYGIEEYDKVTSLDKEDTIAKILTGLNDSLFYFLICNKNVETPSKDPTIVINNGHQCKYLKVIFQEDIYYYRKYNIEYNHKEKLHQYFDLMIDNPQERSLITANIQNESAHLVSKIICRLFEMTLTSIGGADLDVVQTILSEMKIGTVGIGSAKGENRGIKAFHQAIQSFSLENTIQHSKNILLIVTASTSMCIAEVSNIIREFRNFNQEDCGMVYGIVYCDEMDDELEVMIVVD